METPPPIPPSSRTPNPPAPTKPGMPIGIVLLIVGAAALVGLSVLAVLAALLFPALGNAKSKAQSIHCLNNLKQLGLAARIYAVDQNGRYPATWLQMTNEIGSPSILTCPADTAHQRATAWVGIGPGNFSYVLDGKGVTESQTNRVISQCPIHGHLLLADGRVIQTRSPRQPNPVAQRQGANWYDGPTR